MFYLVFNKKDKEELIKQGATFVCKQGSAFLMKINNDNFEMGKINCLKTNEMNF